MAGPRKPLPPRHGFALNCLHCGEAYSVTVHLHDVLSFSCAECNGEYGLDEVREILTQWDRALGWLLTAPPVEE